MPPTFQFFHQPVARISYSGTGHFTCLHAEAHTTTLLLTSALLHLLANLDVDVEELGDAAVQADGLALVQVTLTVVGGDTLLGAGLGEAEEEDALECVGCAVVWRDRPGLDRGCVRSV